MTDYPNSTDMDTVVKYHPCISYVLQKIIMGGDKTRRGLEILPSSINYLIFKRDWYGCYEKWFGIPKPELANLY